MKKFLVVSLFLFFLTSVIYSANFKDILKASYEKEIKRDFVKALKILKSIDSKNLINFQNMH